MGKRYIHWFYLVFIFIVTSTAFCHACEIQQRYCSTIPNLLAISMLLSLVVSAFIFKKRILLPILTGLSIFIIPVVLFVYADEGKIDEGYFELYLFGSFVLLNLVWSVIDENEIGKKISRITVGINICLIIFFMVMAGTTKISVDDNVHNCQKNLITLGEATKKYAADHNNQYPESLEELMVLPGYVSGIPECKPQGCSERTLRYLSRVHGFHYGEYQYEVSTDKTRFTIHCTSTCHSKAFDGKPIRYDSKCGLDTGI